MIWWASSLAVAAEDRQQLVQPGLHPPKVADVAPIDDIRVMTEVVIGELLQPPVMARHWSAVHGLPSSQVMALCAQALFRHKSPVQLSKSLQSAVVLQPKMPHPGCG